MANTQIQTKHTDIYLTNFIQRYQSPAIDAEFIAPSFKVKRPSDKYLIYGKDNMRVYDDTIGRREPIKEIDLFADEATYTCVEHGVGAFVYDRDQSNVDRPIRVMEEKTKHIKDSKERNRCYRVYQIAASTSLVPTQAITAQWTAVTTATPVHDILNAMAAIENSIGVKPNSIIMNFQSAVNAIKTDNWKEYFKYTDSGFKNGLWNLISGLKHLGLDPRVSSDRGVSSYDGCSSDPDWETMLGDKVLIFYRESNPTTQSNCFMFSPFVKRDIVEKFRKDEQRGYKITCYDDIDELLVNANAARILNNVY